MPDRRSITAARLAHRSRMKSERPVPVGDVERAMCLEAVAPEGAAQRRGRGVQLGVVVDRERRPVVLVGEPEPMAAAEDPIVTEPGDRIGADAVGSVASRAAACRGPRARAVASGLTQATGGADPAPVQHRDGQGQLQRLLGVSTELRQPGEREAIQLKAAVGEPLRVDERPVGIVGDVVEDLCRIEVVDRGEAGRVRGAELAVDGTHR
jgi:hypothetical protein